MGSGGRFHHVCEASLSSVLSGKEVVSVVKTLRQVFESCLGPYSNCVLIHNAVGGHVTVTSSASRLLSSMQISNPVLQLITTAMQQHLSVYGEGGSVSTTLTLNIIEHALEISLRQDRCLALDVFDFILESAVSYLTSETCPVRCDVQLNNLDDMLRVLQGVLMTKPACGMSANDIKCLSHCLLKITLNHWSPEQLTDDDFCSAVVLGHPVSSSYVQQGILIEASQLPVYSNMAAPTAADPTVTMSVAKYPVEIRRSSSDPASSGRVLVAVFSTSLAGNCSDNFNVAENVEVALHVNLEKIIVDRLLTLAQSLVNSGAQIVVCQKVIHPQMKRCLRRDKLVVVDRVGRCAARQLARQSGTQLIATTDSPVSDQQFGYVDGLSHHVIADKSYWCFEGGVRPIHSLVLCTPSDGAATELKQVVSTSRRVLELILREPTALCGGGKWQRHLADYIRRIGHERATEYSQQAECHREDVIAIADCLADSLDRIAQQLSPRLSPDSIQERSTAAVLDVMLPAVSGLRTAVLLAQSVLSIEFYRPSATV